jgi:hypothetical protein
VDLVKDPELPLDEFITGNGEATRRFNNTPLPEVSSFALPLRCLSPWNRVPMKKATVNTMASLNSDSALVKIKC